jgi:hypothetical protein
MNIASGTISVKIISTWKILFFSKNIELSLVSSLMSRPKPGEIPCGFYTLVCLKNDSVKINYVVANVMKV